MDGRRTSYDAVADRYAAELGAELDHKPLDRALLDAVAELARGGPVADVGAGPGHVAHYLAGRGATALALDLSPAMCALAAVPALAADMTALPLARASVNAVVCLYAVIHLNPPQRAAAYQEFNRVLCPGGHVLVAFHVSDDETPPGGERHLQHWWGHAVDLVFRFLDPAPEVPPSNTPGWNW